MREKELSDLGFHRAMSQQGIVEGGVLRRADRQISRLAYQSDEANANAQLSARLPYILAAFALCALREGPGAQEGGCLPEPGPCFVRSRVGSRATGITSLRV